MRDPAGLDIVGQSERVTDAAPSPERDIDALPDESLSLEAQITAALSQLGEVDEGAKVQIWRLNPTKPSERIFMSEYSPKDFTLARVQEDMGGGYFEAIVRAPRYHPTTKQVIGEVIVKRPRFRVVGESRDPTLKLPAVVVAQNPGQPDSIKYMMDGFERVITQLADAMKRPPEKSLADQLKDFAAIRDIFAPAQAQQNPITVVTEMIKGMKEIQEIAGVGGNNLPENMSGDGAMALEFLRLFGPALRDKVMAERPSAPAPALRDSVVVPMHGEPGAESAPEKSPPDQPSDKDLSPVDLMKMGQEMMLKGYVAGLVAQARANNDIEPIAQEVYEQASEELYSWLEVPDYLGKLAAYHADVKLFPTWFQNLRERVLQLNAEKPEQ